MYDPYSDSDSGDDGGTSNSSYDNETDSDIPALVPAITTQSKPSRMASATFTCHGYGTIPS